MIATNKLRFVQRVVPFPGYGQNVGKTVRILQQWWEFETIEKFERQTYGTPYGEWRDVPVEEEK